MTLFSKKYGEAYGVSIKSKQKSLHSVFSPYQSTLRIEPLKPPGMSSILEFLNIYSIQKQFRRQIQKFSDDAFICLFW